jgi:hypothetical protein
MMALDAKIDEQVLVKAEEVIQRILHKDTDIAVVERFFGRLMARFGRASETKISGSVRALHLVAPVDFGRKRDK